jgi:hypothetical protein
MQYSALITGSEVEGWRQGSSPEMNETELGELICLIFGRIRCYLLYLSLCSCMMWQILIRCRKRCLLQIVWTLRDLMTGYQKIIIHVRILTHS